MARFDASCFETVRGSGLAPLDHVINAVRAELKVSIAPDVKSDRSRDLLDMIDLILRNAIVTARGAGRDGLAAEDAAGPDAARSEEQALLQVIREEDEIEPLVRTAERAAIFDVTPERLTRYLRDRVPALSDCTVTSVNQLLGGLSKDTFFVDLESPQGVQRVILRRDIAGPPIDSSAADEFALLRVLFDRGLPVPEPLVGEADPTFFGMPFQISRRVLGSGASSAVEIGTFGGDGLGACLALADFLARLHDQDISELPFDVAPDLTVRDYAERQVRHWRQWWTSNRMTPSPIMTLAFDWLENNPPLRGRPVLVHGDAGLHNIIMHEGRISAMLDWELVHIGGAAEDLLYSRTWVEKIMPWNDFLDAYRKAGGQDLDPSTADYYELFNYVRNVTCTIAQARGFRDAEQPALASAYSGLKWYRDNILKASRKVTALLAKVPDGIQA